LGIAIRLPKKAIMSKKLSNDGILLDLQ